MLKDLISQYIEEIRSTHIEEFKDKAAEVEQFRVKFLGRKGVMNELFEQFKTLPNEQKKEMGIALNELTNAALARVEEFKNYVEEKMDAEEHHALTLPADRAGVHLSARRHPQQRGRDRSRPLHPHRCAHEAVG